jgi:hypothetical protein
LLFGHTGALWQAGDEQQNAFKIYLKNPNWYEMWSSNCKIKPKEGSQSLNDDLTYVFVETELVLER